MGKKGEVEKYVQRSGMMGKSAAERMDGKSGSGGGVRPLSPKWPRLAEPHNACSTV